MELKKSQFEKNITSENDENNSTVTIPNITRSKKHGCKRITKKATHNCDEDTPALLEDTPSSESQETDTSSNDIDETESIVPFNPKKIFIQNQMTIDNLTWIPSSRQNSISQEDDEKEDKLVRKR